MTVVVPRAKKGRNERIYSSIIYQRVCRKINILAETIHNATRLLKMITDD